MNIFIGNLGSPYYKDDFEDAIVRAYLLKENFVGDLGLELYTETSKDTAAMINNINLQVQM